MGYSKNRPFVKVDVTGEVDKRFDEVTSQLAETEDEIDLVTKNPNYYDGAIFTIIDDDIRIDVRDVWLSVLQDTGAKITFAAITDWVGTTDYMTLQEIKDLQASGHEIVSQTATHISTSNLTVKQAEIEYPKSKKWLIDNGFKGYDTVVYPGGMSSELLEIKAVARRHYKYGVATILTGQPNIAPVDNWRVARINGDNDSLESLKTKVDKAKLNKSWILLMTHSHVLGSVGAQKMRSLIEYVQSSNVSIMPFGEAQKYKGNAVAIGEYTDKESTFIGANGAIKTKQNLNTHKDLDSIMDTPATDYNVNSKTIMTLNSITDTNFGVGGVYEVFRSVDDFYSYSTFTPWRTNVLYMRKWDNPNSKWKEFEPISNYTIGLWTPTIEGSTAKGVHTYAKQVGRYSKNGNIITASFYIRVNYPDLDSVMAGDLMIGGLPFDVVGGGDRGVFQIDYNNITLGANYFNVSVQPIGKNLHFYKSGSGVFTATLPVSALTTDQVVVLRGQVTYRVE